MGKPESAPRRGRSDTLTRTVGIRLPMIQSAHTNPTRPLCAAALAGALAVPHQSPRSRVGLVLPAFSTPFIRGETSRPARNEIRLKTKPHTDGESDESGMPPPR